EVKHNSMERVTKVSATNTGRGGGSGYTGAPSGGGTSPTGTTDTGSGVQGGGVDLQGARETFQTQKSELINDIRSILDLGADEGTGSGLSAAISPDAGAGSINSVNVDIYGKVRKPKVIWKSDSNTLYVVATRLQHMWVEGFLAAAARPQPLIAIEIKFFET